MDKGTFLLFDTLGFVVALAFFFPLGAKRRGRLPSFFWWLFLVPGAILCFYGLSHATVPSFAPRVTAIGKAYDMELLPGKDVSYRFHFLPDGATEPVSLETQIILPGWHTPPVFNERTYRIEYLQDPQRTLSNEAIDIAILTGRDAGFHSSVDARPLGKWLAVPVGAALAIFGYLGIRFAKDDELAATKVEDES